MKDEEFVYLYLTNDMVRAFPCLQPGEEEALSANALLVLLLATSESAWCADCFNVADYNKYTNTSDNANYIKSTLNISDRVYSDAIRLLVKNNLMYKVKKDVYIINPWICAHGDAQNIQSHRIYCYYNNIFCPPAWGWRIAETDEEKTALKGILSEDASKQKHACVYVNNLKNYTCFNGMFNSKRASLTDLILFFMFATSAQFVKYPSTIELNNVISRSTKELDKIADLLQLKKRAVQYALNNLTNAHLLHKIGNENGKYIVNPFLSAKGKKDKIQVFQSTILQDGSYFCGFAAGNLKYNDNIIVNNETGEIQEVK